MLAQCQRIYAAVHLELGNPDFWPEIKIATCYSGPGELFTPILVFLHLFVSKLGAYTAQVDGQRARHVKQTNRMAA